MANIQSAKKRIRVIAAKTAQNKVTRGDLRTAIKKANVALEENADNKAELVKTAMVKLDKAASKGIIHKNNAANKKSALAARLNG